MTYEKMLNFGSDNNVNMVVDLTQPYAKIVLNNTKRVAKELKISYIRYIRKIIEKIETLYI